jgi:serine/threonine-protein kinase
MPGRTIANFELLQELGAKRGGAAYKALDTRTGRLVVVHVLREAERLTRHPELTAAAALNHPNLLDIWEAGEFEEEGRLTPFLVTPFLDGVTLEELIRHAREPLTAERAGDIAVQTCAGLQAAHERGLVHGHLTPGSLLVTDRGVVKIMDFGLMGGFVAESVGPYTSPEHVLGREVVAVSDIFSLGVITYEALTLRNPFARSEHYATARAIVQDVPPPAHEVNPAVSQAVSRVIQKAMAKQPWHRFSSARDFGETLQKVVRNEHIEFFDPARIQPRIERATRAFEQGDYQFADEILSELEVEGHVDLSISSLRRQIDQSQRQKTIAQLLDNARRHFEEAEYPLALQRIQELLALDPAHGAALVLKSTIESKRSEQKIEDWFSLARQHMQQNAFNHARQALQNVLQVKPRDTRALQLLAEVDRQEQELVYARQEQEQLYAKALEAWQNGEVGEALSKLELLVDIERRSPDTAAPERSTAFQNFYNQVRLTHEAIKSAYEQARQHLVDGNFDAALDICNQQLARHPGQTLFQALKFDVEEAQRQALSARIAEIDRQVEAELDLEKRVHILTEALGRFPGEAYFERALRTMSDKRDLVNSVAGKARAHEERGQFADALSQWQILRTIYSQYPSLDFEIQRVERRRDQQLRSKAKARWVEQIDWQLASGDYARARKLLQSASAEFPRDPELAELENLAMQGLERTADAQRLLAEGQQLCAQQRFGEGVEVLRRAQQLDEKNVVIRTALLGTLLEQARVQLDQDWRAADALAQQALDVDPANAQAKSLRALALDRKREEFVDECVAQARQFQAAGHLQAALAVVDQCLSAYPHVARLAQLKTTLTKALTESEAAQSRRSGVAVNEPAAFEAETDLGPAAGPAFDPPPAPSEPPEEILTPQPVPVLDHVHFTITAPSRLEPGGSCELYFWVHLEKQRRSIIGRAMLALGVRKPEGMVVKSEGPVSLARGTVVSARVSIRGLNVDPSEKSVVWSGDTGCASFVIAVPPGTAQRQYHGTVSIRVNSCEIARMDFLLRVAGRSGRVPAKLKRHATAFASYASEDRDAVLARVQGMQKVAPWLKVFMDVVDLRSGELWEDKLYKVIRGSDIFYLFWCSHARASKWVDREWRYAYAKRGLEFIDPVPLEPPQSAPPPDELKTKHFNDLWTELNAKAHGS